MSILLDITDSFKKDARNESKKHKFTIIANQTNPRQEAVFAPRENENRKIKRVKRQSTYLTGMHLTILEQSKFGNKCRRIAFKR
jgi:hypothetical protein